MVESVAHLAGVVEEDQWAVNELIRDHRFLADLEAQRLPRTALAAFVGERYQSIEGDRRALETLAARFGEHPGGTGLTVLAEAKAREALQLEALGRAVGLEREAV